MSLEINKSTVRPGEVSYSKYSMLLFNIRNYSPDVTNI